MKTKFSLPILLLAVGFLLISCQNDTIVNDKRMIISWEEDEEGDEEQRAEINPELLERCQMIQDRYWLEFPEEQQLMPYEYLMTKYCNLLLAYFKYDWNYEDFLLTSEWDSTYQFIMEQLFLNDMEYEEVNIGATEFDAYCCLLDSMLIDELNYYECVRMKMDESAEIEAYVSVDEIWYSPFVSLCGQEYSKLDILYRDEYEQPLEHEKQEDPIVNCRNLNQVEEEHVNNPRYLGRYKLHMLWPDNIVKYRNYKKRCPNMEIMKLAMNEWKNAAKGNLYFEEVKDNGWQRFTWGLGLNYHVCLSKTSDSNVGGSSTLGYVPWAHIHINAETSGIRTYLHELGHTLGLIHEMQRCDRDEYVYVYYSAIKPKYKYNFHKYAQSTAQPYGEFDFESIMMYSMYAFGDGEQTIYPLDDNEHYDIYDGLSGRDIKYINYLYN